MKIVLFISILMLSLGISAQSDTLNQIDSEGKKQGYWIIYGKDEPQKGYPEEGKIQEGTYLDDRKNGQWILYHKDGVTPKSKGEFTNNRPNGPYEEYYHNGSLKSKGTLYSRRYVGEWFFYWKNGNIQIERFYNDLGVKDGMEIHYFEDGQIKLEKHYKNGVRNDTMKVFHPNGDLKSITFRDSLGREDKIYPKDSSPFAPISLKKEGLLCFDKEDVYTNEYVLNINGYKKLYNKNKELLSEGEFKNNCLWNGKYYVYDEYELCIKVEIWLEGEYHSGYSFRE